MKFLQLKDGICVRKSDIVAVERLDEGGSRVWTMRASYDCPFLYESIIQLLEVEDIEETITQQTTLPPNNLWGSQHWRG